MIKQFIAAIKSSPGKWIFILTAATGLLLRFEYLREYSNLVHFPFALGPDVMEYDERAKELLNGIIFPDTPEIHAPLYSLFLAFWYKLFSCSIAAVRGIQLFLNWGAFVATALLVRKLSSSWKLATIFLALALFTPVLFFHQAELISESLLAPLSAALLWLLYRADKRQRNYFGAGIIIGLMVLTHGLMNFILLAEAGYFIIKKQWKNAILIFSGAIIVTGGVIAVKSLHYRKFTPIQSNSMFNLWIGHNPDATGGCYLPPGKWAKEREKLITAGAEHNTSFDKIILEDILHFYKHSPQQLALLPLKKLALLLSPEEAISGADSMYLILLTKVQKTGTGMMAAVILLALCGTYFLCKRKKSEYIHFYITGGALCAGLLLTVVSGRYRQGLMPALLLLAAAGAFHLGKKAWFVIIPCVIGGALLIPPLSGGIQRNGRAASILGEAHFRLKEFRQAQELLQIAERHDDHPERFDNMLGAIAEERGNILIASVRYTQAIEKAPGHPDGYLNKGHLYFYNFPEEREIALQLIKAALARKSDLPSAYDMLGQDMAQKKDYSGALKMFEQASFYAPDNELYKKKIELCRTLAKERGKNAPESGNR